MSDEIKYPKILPKDDPNIVALIRLEHENQGHAGTYHEFKATHFCIFRHKRHFCLDSCKFFISRSNQSFKSQYFAACLAKWRDVQISVAKSAPYDGRILVAWSVEYRHTGLIGTAGANRDSNLKNDSQCDFLKPVNFFLFLSSL